MWRGTGFPRSDWKGLTQWEEGEEWKWRTLAVRTAAGMELDLISQVSSHYLRLLLSFLSNYGHKEADSFLQFRLKMPPCSEIKKQKINVHCKEKKNLIFQIDFITLKITENQIVRNSCHSIRAVKAFVTCIALVATRMWASGVLTCWWWSIDGMARWEEPHSWRINSKPKLFSMFDTLRNI